MNNQNQPTLLTLLTILLVILISLLSWDIYLQKTTPPTVIDSKFILYLDSVKKSTDALLIKVDSLERTKTNVYREITKINLKYDTIKITIDSMLPLDATFFLLSKSRQLSSKGIE
jgi:hypothetical protein